LGFQIHHDLTMGDRYKVEAKCLYYQFYSELVAMPVLGRRDGQSLYEICHPLHFRNAAVICDSVHIWLWGKKKIDRTFMSTGRRPKRIESSATHLRQCPLNSVIFQTFENRVGILSISFVVECATRHASETTPYTVRERPNNYRRRGSGLSTLRLTRKSTECLLYESLKNR